LDIKQLLHLDLEELWNFSEILHYFVVSSLSNEDDHSSLPLLPIFIACFDFSQLNGEVVVLHCTFDLRLYEWDQAHFHVFVGHAYILKKFLSNLLTVFYFGCLHYCIRWFFNSHKFINFLFQIVGTLINCIHISPLTCMTWKCCLIFCVFILIFLIVLLESQKVFFSFHEVQHILSFVACSSDVMSKKSWPKPNLWKFIPLFFKGL
jgi:hypothetical protein